MPRPVIHVVLGESIVLGAYTRADIAYRHARCITGADVVSCELREALPPEILADIELEWEDDEMTPEIVADPDAGAED